MHPFCPHQVYFCTEAIIVLCFSNSMKSLRLAWWHTAREKMHSAKFRTIWNSRVVNFEANLNLLKAHLFHRACQLCSQPCSLCCPLMAELGVLKSLMFLPVVKLGYYIMQRLTYNEIGMLQSLETYTAGRQTPQK